MRMVSAVLGAVLVLVIYYVTVWYLDGKLSLQLKKKKNIPLDTVVLVVGAASFCVLCYMGSRQGVYEELLPHIRNMILILAMSVFAVTDAKARLVPNRVLVVFLAAWAMIMGVAVIGHSEEGLSMLGQSLIGGLAGGLIFLLCYLLSKKQLGAGDVKLAFVMGLYLTGQRIVGALAYGILICCVYSLVQVLRKKLSLKDSVSLVPFLYMGTLVVFLIFLN